MTRTSDLTVRRIAVEEINGGNWRHLNLDEAARAARVSESTLRRRAKRAGVVGSFATNRNASGLFLAGAIVIESPRLALPLCVAFGPAEFKISRAC